MRPLRYLSLGVMAAFLLLAGVGFSLPSRYEAVSAIEIDAPAHIAFRAVNNLPEWQYWYVEELDGFEQYFSGPETGVGALYLWEGEGRDGRLEIIESVPVERVEMRLLAQNATREAAVSFRFETKGEKKTLVTIRQTGSFGWRLSLRAQAYFYGYSEQLSQQYEGKLQALKAYCESQDPAEIPMKLQD